MGVTTENKRRLAKASKFDDAQLDGMLENEFSSTLDKMIRDKKLGTTDLVKNTTLSKAYINRLRNPSRKNDKPSRIAVIDLALGMNCTLDETNLLLKRARYQELYSRNEMDAVIIFGMLHNFKGLKIRHLLEEQGLYNSFKDK